MNSRFRNFQIQKRKSVVIDICDQGQKYRASDTSVNTCASTSELHSTKTPGTSTVTVLVIQRLKTHFRKVVNKDSALTELAVKEPT